MYEVRTFFFLKMEKKVAGFSRQILPGHRELAINANGNREIHCLDMQHILSLYCGL